MATVSIGLDGTTIYLRDEGYRETMVGTIALYDDDGERLHTTYIGAPPEYGKDTFMTRLAGEIEHVKQLYPDALYIGVADGATDNWPFLNQYTSLQVTDFWHATEYLADVAEALFLGEKQQSKRTDWLKQRLCQSGMKRRQKGASIILSLRTLERSNRWEQFWDKISEYGVAYC